MRGNQDQGRGKPKKDPRRDQDANKGQAQGNKGVNQEGNKKTRQDGNKVDQGSKTKGTPAQGNVESAQWTPFRHKRGVMAEVLAVIPGRSQQVNPKSTNLVQVAILNLPGELSLALSALSMDIEVGDIVEIPVLTRPRIFRKGNEYSVHAMTYTVVRPVSNIGNLTKNSVDKVVTRVASIESILEAYAVYPGRILNQEERQFRRKACVDKPIESWTKTCDLVIRITKSEGVTWIIDSMVPLKGRRMNLYKISYKDFSALEEGIEVSQPTFPLVVSGTYKEKDHLFLQGFWLEYAKIGDKMETTVILTPKGEESNIIPITEAEWEATETGMEKIRKKELGDWVDVVARIKKSIMSDPLRRATHFKSIPDEIQSFTQEGKPKPEMKAEDAGYADYFVKRPRGKDDLIAQVLIPSKTEILHKAWGMK